MPRDDAPHDSPQLLYHRGLAILRHVREGKSPGWMHYDRRIDAWIAPGHRMSELRAWASEHGIHALTAPAELLPSPLFDTRAPREYQQEALARWLGSGGRGSVVLPTGAGKSLVAVLAIHESGGGACVLAPTKALVHQWFAQLADAFGADRVGAYYGDEKDVRPIMVTTYHSAFPLLERWGADYDLLVFDEIHHLADRSDGTAKSWHDTLTIAPACHRLGLTATYPDSHDDIISRFVGPVVYRKTIGEMADRELARFAVERRFVHLTDEEQERYDYLTNAYQSFYASRRYKERFGTPDDAWRVFMSETRTSLPARRAYHAFLERETLVASSHNKIEEAGNILRLYPAEQAIIFCGRWDTAEHVSRTFAVPALSADTPASERKEILDAISNGTIRAVASVKVLDEGWDVPSAKLGIVLGDSTRGGKRQHVQRLGRILRRQGDAVASMYEIVTSGTHEFFASQKRGTAVKDLGDRQLGLGF